MGFRRKSSFWALTIAALACAVASACVFEPTVTTGPCKQDSDCTDDGIPCTREVCSADGFCDRAPQDLPFGDTRCDDQNPCTDEVCSGGACAYMPSTSAPTDGNECTSDACVNGVATYTPVADDSPCGFGNMLVCTGGQCKCTTATQCGVSTECLTFDCVSSSCMSTTKAKGELVDGKDPGDCLKNVCDGASGVVTVPDTSDPPLDPNAGNCKKKACDDQGTVVDVDDPTDVPADDSNVCTTEGCSGGTPILYEAVADGTVCAGMVACGPAAGGGFEVLPPDVCVSGECVKQAPMSCDLYKCNAGNTDCLAACQGAADCIQGTFCEGAMNACKPVAGTGNTCQNAGECGSGFCVDGVCCNTACAGLCQRCNDPLSKGLCVATSSGLDPDNECAGADACNGVGACAKPQGAMCGQDIECLGKVCEDLTCCNAACAGPCRRCDIMGKQGTCSNVDANAQVTGCTGAQACDGSGNCKTKNGQSCGGNAECMSNVCQDGVCCNNGCAGACARCDIPGSIGTCTNVAPGEQVAGCTGTSACDGSNGCKKVNGQACAAGSECVSGFCVDEDLATSGTQGVCCNAACTDVCKSCAGAKTVGGINGVCDLILHKTDPDDECSGVGCNSANGGGCCFFNGSTNVCK